jgi:hypothetical protein
MKHLHTMVGVTDLEASLRFCRAALGLQSPALPAAEPWASMPDTGSW